MNIKSLIYIVIIYTLSTSIIYCDDTTISSKDTTTIIKDVDSATSNDEQYINFATIESEGINPKKCGYIQIFGSLIGAFFAAFFAALVALLTVNRTHKKNKEIETKRENDATHKREEKYNALLFGIYSEIQANEALTEIIKGGIQSYLDYVEIRDKPIATDVFNTLKINFVEQCRLNMINNESFSPNVLRWVSKYIYKVDEINRNLEFHKIMQIPKHLHTGDSLFDALTVYFNEILKSIKDLEEGNIELKRIILYDHQNFPHCNLQFTDNSLTESSNSKIEDN